jgi:hypothetical protein
MQAWLDAVELTADPPPLPSNGFRLPPQLAIATTTIADAPRMTTLRIICAEDLSALQERRKTRRSRCRLKQQRPRSRTPRHPPSRNLCGGEGVLTIGQQERREMGPVFLDCSDPQEVSDRRLSPREE